MDNHGKGEAFSPTDMICTMLASCILTIIGIASAEHGFSIDGTRAGIDKIMYEKPRRIGEIHIDFHFPEKYPEKIRKIIEKAASACPVGKSLHPDIKQKIQYHYA
jgi:putative redox protein